MIKHANGRGFCMLGFVSDKELKEEQRMAGYQGFFYGRDVHRSLCHPSLPTEVTSSV